MSIESPGSGEDDTLKIGVEAGHMYSPHHFKEANDKPLEALHGLALATRVRDRLEQSDIDTHQIFFIDDISPHEEQKKSQDAWRSQMFMNRPLEQATELIETPLRIMTEHDAIQPGLELVALLKANAAQSDDYRLSKDGRHVVYGQGDASQTIPLTGYQNGQTLYPDLPSCEVMDLATYKKRIKQDGQTVTLLPQWYGPEQARVQKLFGLLGEKPPIVTALYDEKGQIVSVADWSGGHFEALAEMIRQVDAR
jgi:hypothetical protein